MSVKVYIKKGQKNYKENKLVNKLSQAIERKIQENPEFANEYKPATNFNELQQQYDTYCVDNVEFTEIKDNPETTDIYEQHKEFRGTMKDVTETKEIVKAETFEDNDSFIDPLNREEPIVRDYVTSNEFPDDTKPEQQSTGKTTFSEPTSFRDSFELPGTEQSPKTNQQAKPKRVPQEPINPNWDEMGNAKKRKNTKKFAKYIVETTCMLAEKGFVWYANKDINDAKLAEYELNNEMDLNLLVTMEDGQEATVRQFFQVQCLRAEQLSKIDPEEKSDLIDALAEVMQEKGIGPTPTQELLLISLKIFGGQVATLFMLKTSTNSLLAQLRAMKEEEQQTRYTPPPQPRPQPKPEPKIEKIEAVEEIKEEPKSDVISFEDLKTEGDFTLLEQIENTEETKE